MDEWCPVHSKNMVNFCCSNQNVRKIKGFLEKLENYMNKL